MVFAENKFGEMALPPKAMHRLMQSHRNPGVFLTEIENSSPKIQMQVQNLRQPKHEGHH